MDNLLKTITTSSIVYLTLVITGGLILALIIRLLSARLKSNFRKSDKSSIRAQLIDAIDGALCLWIIMAGVYLGLISLEQADIPVLRQGFTVLSVIVAIYAAIRAQGYAIAWIIQKIGSGTGQTKVFNSLVPVTRQITSLTTLSIGVLIVLDQLGISIAPLVAGLGIGGLAVALALQGILTNFFAGLTFMTDGSIRVGDYVEIDGGMVGIVEMIGWRTTRICLLSNNVVMIPNTKLADNIATNYNYPIEEMSVYVQMGVSYFSNLEQVEAITVEVAKETLETTTGAVRDFEPSIWYTNFGDSNINFWVVLRAQSYLDSWLVQHEFIKAIFRRYDQESIEISFPARNVFIRKDTDIV